MRDFYKMSFSEINKEMENFQRKIITQQAQGIPATPKQMKYYFALSKAYKRINAEYAKWKATQMKLVKIYSNKAVYLTKTNRLVVEIIPPETAEILEYYKKIPVNNF